MFLPTLLSTPKTHQSGVVLITTLVLLLVMTMIGLSGMQVTSLEEKMASNMRDVNLAFQAAESALRAGEEVVLQPTLPSFDKDGTNGMYSTTSTENILDNLTVTALWAAANKAEFNAANFAGLAVNPNYIIEEMIVSGGGGSSLDGSSFSTTGYYRITSRATGGTTTAVAVLQSVFKR